MTTQKIGRRNDTAVDQREIVPFIELSAVSGGLASADEL